MSNVVKLLKESLAQARTEHAALDEAMRDIENLIARLRGGSETAGGKRRGRPPGAKNKSRATEAATEPKRTKKKAGRRNWSPEQKKAAAARMRAYWAAKNRQD